MVRVPVYQSDVQLRPELRQDLAPNATPQAFGSDLGTGMESLARGGMSAAHSLAVVQALEDETIVRQKRNEFLMAKDELQYDPEKGYLQSRGKDALTGFDKYGRDLDRLRREHSADLTPSQQRLFEKTVAPLEIDARRAGIVHKSAAFKAFVVEQSVAGAESFKNQALLHYQDAALWQKYTAAGQAELHTLGDKLGWSPEKRRLEQENFVSDTVKKTTLRIAESDPLAAERFMKEKADHLTAADTYSLEHGLKSEIQIEKSKREADAILQNGRKEAAPASRTVGQTGPSSSRAFLTARLTAGHTKDHIDGLDEDFATNLTAMLHDAPPEIRQGLGVLSGFRSVERQGQLWNDALKKYGSPEAARKWVAPPGHSQHNHGQAVDLAYNGESLAQAPKEVVDWVHANARKYGMYFPMGNEPWHIEPVGSRSGTVAYRGGGVAPRAAMASYDDIEGRLAAISDPKVRDLTRQRVMSAITVQNQAAEANQKQAAATLWQYVDQGYTPDQVPLEVRQAAGMSAVSSAWGYLSTAKNGRDVQDDETLSYSMRRFAASNPDEFAKVDLNDYRDRLSRSTLKELTGLQTGALKDQRKAREEGLHLTEAYSQATEQLRAVGITTEGKKGSQLEATHQRVARFNNALSSQMDEFKRENNNRAPTQPEIQSMINRLLLPVVMRQQGTVWDSTWTPPGADKTFAFDAAMRPDDYRITTATKYEDIPIDLRRGIAVDLERELGRKPFEREVVHRYGDFILNRDPTPIPPAYHGPADRIAGAIFKGVSEVVLGYPMRAVGGAIDYFHSGDHKDANAR